MNCCWGFPQHKIKSNSVYPDQYQGFSEACYTVALSMKSKQDLRFSTRSFQHFELFFCFLVKLNSIRDFSVFDSEYLERNSVFISFSISNPLFQCFISVIHPANQIKELSYKPDLVFEVPGT